MYNPKGKINYTIQFQNKLTFKLYNLKRNFDFKIVHFKSTFYF